MKVLWISFFFLSLLHLSFQRSSPTDDSYVAAVLEYAFDRNLTVNLENYLRYISEAASQNADIVIFPELTLGSSPLEVPINGDLQRYPIPYLNSALYDSVLVALSQAAAVHEIYVLVNLQEVADCVTNHQSELCPENKTYYFNTDVVFNRNGAIIDRYRKINLFGEFSRTPALNPDLGVFTTDFGVTFGHFICFDLMFQVPAVQSVQKLNLTDIIFSTMWFSELPFLTAVQIQQAYAYTLNVNMLASGANNVRVGSAGSGIYSGRAGALVSTMPAVPTTSLLVARVPKIPGQITGLSSPSITTANGIHAGPIAADPADADGLLLIKDPSITAHVSRQLVNGYQQFVLSDKDVSCTFRVNISYGSADEGPKFRAIVRDGINKYAHRKAGVLTCAVVACKDHDLESCGYRYNNNKGTIIEKLEIEMLSIGVHYNYTLMCDDIIYFPTTLQNNILPMDPKNFSFKSETVKRRQDIVMALSNPREDLVTFGVWGRIFLRDLSEEHTLTEEEKKKFTDFEKLFLHKQKKDKKRH